MSLGVIIPMVLSLAVPSLFVATGHRFERAASDSIAAQTLEGFAAAEQGLSVTANGLLRSHQALELDFHVSQKLAGLPALDQAVLTVYSPRGTSAVVKASDQPPERIGGQPRFFARDGAIDSLEVLEDTDEFFGVYVSQDFAQRGELEVGSTIHVEIEDTGAVVQVQGIYRNLWPTPPPYWDDVSPQLVPRWDSFFQQPSSEALIASQELLFELGVAGFLRWDAPAAHDASTLAELEAVAAQFTQIDEDLVRDGDTVRLLTNFAGLAPPTPTIATSIDQALSDARASTRSLDRPLASSQAAGVTLGLLVVAAGASFRARQRRTIWRVMNASGEGVGRFAWLALIETLVPAVLATAVGVLGSAVMTSMLVPGGAAGLDAIRLRSVFAAGGLAVLVSVIVTTAIAARSRRQTSGSHDRWRPWFVLPLVGFATAGWIQAGTQTATGTVSLLVVVVPIAVLSAAAGGLMMLLHALLSGIGRRGSRAPLAVLIGLRRTVSGAAGATVLAGALAVSFGLMVYAATLAETSSTSVAAKSATITGAESVASLPFDRFPDNVALPAGSSLVYRGRASLTPGDETLQVIAIDPDTFADVAVWPDEFGSLSASDVVARLAPVNDNEVPAMWLSSRPVPGIGAFGDFETFPYGIVGTLESAPLVSGPLAVLVVRSDALERVALARFVANFEREFEVTPTEAQIEDFFESPLDNYRRRIIATSGVAELRGELENADINARDYLGRSDIADAVTTQATRWSFTYLQFVGLICALASLLGALLYAQERRAGRSLADLVGSTFGTTRSVSVAASAFEFAALGATALVPGVFVAVLAARRLAPTFETMADIPPAVDLDVPLGRVATAAAIVFVLVILAGVITEYFTWGRAERGN